MPEIVVIGAGGFGREVLDVIDSINDNWATRFQDPWRVLGFLDDGEPDSSTWESYGVELLGSVELLVDLNPNVQYVIGIGSPQIRKSIDERFRSVRESPVLVHPTATTGRDVQLGPGSIVCAGVRLTNNIRLGRHVHLNLNSTVGHDARLGDYVTVSPLTAISGYVRLESEVMLGTGAILNPGITVGKGSIVGSGAAVLKDVPAGVITVGVPARVR